MALKLPFSRSRATLILSTEDIKKYGLEFFGFRVYLPFFSRYSFDRQLRILGVTTLTFLLMAIGFSYLEKRNVETLAAQVSRTGDLQAQWQRLQKNVLLSGLSGDDNVDTLQLAHTRFFATLSALERGQTELPVASDEARSALDNLLAESSGLGKLLGRIETTRPLADAFRQAGAMRDNLRLIAENAIDGVAPPLVPKVQQLRLLLVQIMGDVQVLQSSVSANTLDALSTRLAAARAVLAQLPASDPAVAALAQGFDGYQKVLGSLLSNREQLLNAQAAKQQLRQKDPRIQGMLDELLDAYKSAITHSWYGFAAAVSGGLLLLQLLIMSKVYLDDSRRREQEAKEINDRNQKAILRLMNELSDLADGDLSAKATVSEDITGAIADSINYTIDELRKLVSRVISATEQVHKATGDAGRVTQELLKAAQRQATEIRDAGGAVELMTKSIREVDDSAAQSAGVARHTQEVTAQGAQAVRNAVVGMNSIREQIQETAKRIKRLGESSQEIGEIVDLISDITEQTNVLALNAAIQAASAGEAGRGFAVVAEEVQRLAERSAEATKQIGLLVKTIQGDTQDAVSAMEKSTQGVVQGAQLADDAGQSLQQIEQATRELNDLVSSISVSTQVQTDMAQEVATVMADILKITEQTSTGTRLTSASVGQLEKLAQELSGSVSGFKL